MFSRMFLTARMVSLVAIALAAIVGFSIDLLSIEGSLAEAAKRTSQIVLTAFFAVMMSASVLSIVSISADRSAKSDLFYMIVVGPATIAGAGIFAVAFTQQMFGFEFIPKPWPEHMWWQIHLDFACKGAFLDLFESFNLEVVRFEPQEGKLAFAIIEFLCRSAWSAWFAGVLFRFWRLLPKRIPPHEASK